MPEAAPTTTTTTCSAAVSARSAPMLARGRRGATVMAVYPGAVYLRVDGFAHPGLLPVVSTDALRLPNALVLGSAAPQVGWGVQPGDRVPVGDGAVRLPGVTIRRTRVWQPVPVPTAQSRVDVPAPPSVAALASAAWVGPARALAEGALAGEDLADRVEVTVGSGPGLTPSGDDVICGVLLALRVSGADRAAARLWGAVRLLTSRTTTVSACLLAEAADGYAVPAVVRLASALAGGRERRPEVGAATREVRAIGHTSGADLLAGLAGGLAAAQQHHHGRALAGLSTVVPHQFSTADPGVTS